MLILRRNQTHGLSLMLAIPRGRMSTNCIAAYQVLRNCGGM